MSTIVFTSHSVGTKHEELARLLMPNKEAYCKRHGYELRVVQCGPDDAGTMRCLESMREILKARHVLLSIGADVIFTNINKRVPTTDFALTISKEELRWWPINNDVCIWSPRWVGLKMLPQLEIINRS